MPGLTSIDRRRYAAHAVFDTLVTDHACDFARSFGGRVERDAFAVVIRDERHAGSDMRGSRQQDAGSQQGGY